MNILPLSRTLSYTLKTEELVTSENLLYAYYTRSSSLWQLHILYPRTGRFLRCDIHVMEAHITKVGIL